MYIELGMYYEQVKRYLDVFSENQVLVMLYDTLKVEPQAFLNEIFTFLGVVPETIDTTKGFNKAEIPKFPLVNKLIRNLGIDVLISKFLPAGAKDRLKGKFNRRQKDTPKLTEYGRTQLGAYFRDGIHKLETLVDRDFSKWEK